ncbi:MAG: GNAT family N-acetyltransferase [Bulleidia sp.]
MLTIRNAVSGDYEEVESLMKQVQQVHIEIRPDLYRPADPVVTEEAFEHMIEEGSCIVCLDEGQITGVVVSMIRDVHIPVKYDRKVLYIDTLCVDENHRRKGIAQAMMDYMKHIAEQKQCTSIELHVNALNHEAVSFYRHFGFTVQTMMMEIPTGDER